MDTTKIIIDDDYCSWTGTRTIFFQCTHIDHDNMWGEEHRCGGDSMFIITCETPYGIQSHHFCEYHTKQFIDKAKEGGYNIIDMRGVK